MTSPEDALAWSEEQRRRTERHNQIKLDALTEVTEAMTLCPDEERAVFARALVEHAVAAMVPLHDAARVQALLGKLAGRYGGAVKTARETMRHQAELHFRIKR